MQILSLSLMLLPLLLTGTVAIAQVAVSVHDGQIVVSAGTSRIDQHDVQIKEPVKLTIDPATNIQITDEECVLSSETPQSYARGTHLKACNTRPDGTSTVLPHCLEPGSVVVKLDGTIMQPTKDYLIDETWAALGRVEGGRIGKDAKVKISYRAGQMRVDGVEITPAGKVLLVRGIPKRTAPAIPDIAEGNLRLANIFVPYHAKQIEPWQIFELKESYPEPDQQEMQRRAKRIAHALAKLRAGDRVTIVNWGDSVTAGGDASSPGKAFPQFFAQRLRERFPAASITQINAGISATTTDTRLAKINEEVLKYAPDLVTIEFVNDMGFPEAHERANYAKAIAAIQNAGAEVIIITPHFTMPEMMNLPNACGHETRDTVRVLREIAKDSRVALADVSRRWEHLALEGIPYTIYLENGINHPDDRGHELFVKELMTFFPR